MNLLFSVQLFLELFDLSNEGTRNWEYLSLEEFRNFLQTNQSIMKFTHPYKKSKEDW